MGGRKRALSLSQSRLLRSPRLGCGIHRGLEQDSFDTPDTHWVLIEDEEGLCGCIRLLSCAQDYMLPSIFPTALAGEAPPRSNDVGLTRLAIDAERAPRLGNGISELTCIIFREVYAFAKAQGIRELVAVVSLPVERIFRRLGLPIERLGHRQAVDLGAVRGVGIRFHLDERFARAVGQPLQGAYDETRELVTE